MSDIGTTPKRTVLVVDDNAALVDNLREILEDAGYRVISAGTVQEGIRGAAQGVDVALVDLKLPDGQGTALAQHLKERHRDCEIVLLTGFANVESAQAAIRTGACAYLVKPCATSELLLTVGQAMRQVELRAEKRELALRVQRAEKLAAVGTMTAGLSHEIRNPLNSAGLQLLVLERRIGRLAEELRGPLIEPLALVRDEIKRLNHILEDFLQFARPRDFVPAPIDMADVVRRVSRFLETEAERRGLTLETSVEAVPPVPGEEERLRQVLMNLALNAFDAVGTGGRVRFTVTSAPEAVVVLVDDSGPGIPEATRERIFEPFFTTKASGSGLGLPIAHAIVTQHGGTIAIRSSLLGGAQFEIRLPALR